MLYMHGCTAWLLSPQLFVLPLTHILQLASCNICNLCQYLLWDPGGGAHGGAASAAARSQNGAVDASVLHGMLEFFVALARCAAGGWADQEGVGVPVRVLAE